VYVPPHRARTRCRFVSLLAQGCSHSFTCFGQIRVMGRMLRHCQLSIPQPKFSVVYHFIAGSPFPNSRALVRWRPRSDMQLRWYRKLDLSYDMERGKRIRSKWLCSSFNQIHDSLLQTVQTQTWTVDNIPAGTWVTSRNLTYVKVSSRICCVT
jgi:hypothetical protein